MTTFNKDEFNRASVSIREGLQTLHVKVDRLMPAVTLAVQPWFVPVVVGQALLDAFQGIVNTFNEVLRVVGELITSIWAPVTMWEHRGKWQDEVNRNASTVASLLNEDTSQHLNIHKWWQGPAADAYRRVVRGQSQAAARLASIADRVAGVLTACAIAAVPAFLAICFIILKLVAIAALCLALVATGFLAWAGAGGLAVELATDFIALKAVLAGLGAAYTVQVTQYNGLDGELNNTANFPGRAWPLAVTHEYDDATVDDRALGTGLVDDNDWRLSPPGSR